MKFDSLALLRGSLLTCLFKLRFPEKVRDQKAFLCLSAALAVNPQTAYEACWLAADVESPGRSLCFCLGSF